MTAHDPRYLKADAAIRSAFLELFAQNSIEEITASQIINIAGVNRSTFYAHYADKYALLDAIEETFLEQVEAVFEKSPTMGLILGEGSDYRTWEEYFGRLIRFLYDHRKLLASLLARENSTFMAHFTSAFSEALKERGAVSRLGLPTNYQAALLAWATAGLVEEWARGGFADGNEEVVRILVRVAMNIQDAVMG